jgi:hypothetical protein
LRTWRRGATGQRDHRNGTRNCQQLAHLHFPEVWTRTLHWHIDEGQAADICEWPELLMFTVQMAIVTYWHAGNGYFFSSPRGGWEFPLLLTILYAAIFFRGAGRCAVDRMIGKEF